MTNSATHGAASHVRDRWVALLSLFSVLGVAIVETAAGVHQVASTPRPTDLKSLAQVVRSELAADDLIATAPAWIDPVVRSELGDKMPIAMLGRPDARRYPRIFEISLGGARSEDTQGLSPDWEKTFGAYSVRLYRQRAETVTYDIVARYADAKILQFMHDPKRPLTMQSAAVLPDGMPATPCFFQGPSPVTCPPPRGPAGAFVCPQGRIERRTLEIAYRPRLGLSVSPGAGQVTELVWDAIPDDAWQGATLHVWLGLHDYHARKNAIGPAQVLIDLEDGRAQQVISVEPRKSEQALSHVTMPLPAREASAQAAGSLPFDPASAGHRLRIRVFAENAAHHHVGLIAELRR